MPFSLFNSFYTLTRKEIIRFMRIWSQTLLPPVITTSLYFVIFGKYIGSRVGEVGSIDYIQFIIPGLVMLSVITSSFSNVVSSFFGAKFQRSIEELMVSPTPNWVIIAGYTAGGVLRGILVGIIVFGVSMFFARPIVTNPLAIAVFILMTAIVFSLGGLTNGIYAKKFDDVSIFPTFVLTPLTYLGGVFYSIKDLPEFWQNISKLNPIVYMVDGFRYGFYGRSDFNVWLSFGILSGFIFALASINLYMLNKGTGLRS
jgi:ABC-2 type transport system permease protein